jgi:hypothetical protein
MCMHSWCVYTFGTILRFVEKIALPDWQSDSVTDWLSDGLTDRLGDSAQRYNTWVLDLIYFHAPDSQGNLGTHLLKGLIVVCVKCYFWQSGLVELRRVRYGTRHSFAIKGWILYLKTQSSWGEARPAWLGLWTGRHVYVVIYCDKHTYTPCKGVTARSFMVTCMCVRVHLRLCLCAYVYFSVCMKTDM